MKTLAERLTAALQAANLSQEQLAQKVGLSQPAIQKLASGKAQSSRKILEISSALGVSPEWLGQGIGEMSLQNQQDSSIPHESKWTGIDAWDSKTPINDDEVEIPYLKDIEFACGDGRVVDEDHNGFKLRFSKSTLRRVGANTDGSGVICFPAAGDSMEPIIPDGTTVAVDTNNKRVIDGKIYAIAQSGGGNDKLKRIKQLYRKPGGKVVIHSFNVPEDEICDENEVEIIGRVFWYSVII